KIMVGGGGRSRCSLNQVSFWLPRDFSQAGRRHNALKSPYDVRMGKASRTKQASDRRARVAAQREAARRAEQRKRIYLAGGSILAVVIVVVAFVLVKANSNSGKAAPASNGPTGASLTSLTKNVTGVPQATLDKVGAGSIDKSVFIPSSGI